MFEFNAFKLYTGFVDMGLGDVTKVEITYPDIPDKDGYRILPFNEFEDCTKKKITTVFLRDLPFVSLLTDYSKIKLDRISIERSTSNDNRRGILNEFVVKINIVRK